MTDWIPTIVANPIVVGGVGAVVLAVTLIYVIGFFQGREISFWPPRIGPRQSVTSITPPQQKSWDSILGEWFEEIPRSPDRRYSIGVFRPDPDSEILTFDGANYTNSGEQFCTWRSRLVSINPEDRQIYYIFDACIQGELNTSNTGFGVIHLSHSKDGTLTPESGYYIEARVDGKPYTHSMRRLEDVALTLGMADCGQNREQFYERVISAYEIHRTKRSV